MNKKTIVVLMLGAFGMSAAHAGSWVGQCVYPKTKPGKNGYLEFKNPVYVYKTPAEGDKQPLTQLSAFTVKAESKGFVQLATAGDESQKVVGWVKPGDFMLQDLRNCN